MTSSMPVCALKQRSLAPHSPLTKSNPTPRRQCKTAAWRFAPQAGVRGEPRQSLGFVEPSVRLWLEPPAPPPREDAPLSKHLGLHKEPKENPSRTP